MKTTYIIVGSIVAAWVLFQGKATKTAAKSDTGAMIITVLGVASMIAILFC